MVFGKMMLGTPSLLWVQFCSRRGSTDLGEHRSLFWLTTKLVSGMKNLFLGLSATILFNVKKRYREGMITVKEELNAEHVTLLVKVLFRYYSGYYLWKWAWDDWSEIWKNRDQLYFSFGKYHLSIRKVRELICDLNSHRFVTSNSRDLNGWE